jgi:hypothetical protein
MCDDNDGFGYFIGKKWLNILLFRELLIITWWKTTNKFEN